jgi:dihydrofolate reductase
MKFFKNVTWALPVVMGRKTFASIGNKPLPGRKNIVITRQPGWQAEGVSVVDSVDAAASLAEGLNYKEIFIIGGGVIYMIAFDRGQ